MFLVDGKKIAREIIEQLKKLPKPAKKLAAVFVGTDPASASFLKQKKKIADELGIEFLLIHLKENISKADLLLELENLNKNPDVGGIVIQLPLPGKIDRDKILAALAPDKDIDALSQKPKVLPLAVEVVKDVLLTVIASGALSLRGLAKQSYIGYLSDKVVGVVGRGILIGRPIAEWLSGQCREVIIFHIGTDLVRLKDCDLVITGAGKAGLIKPEMLKSGAGVIDFGFAMKDGKISGDLDIATLNLKPLTFDLSFYTPTPGGTGPILVAEIFKNFYRLNSLPR